MYTGPRALVRFHNGTTYAMPSAPLRELGLKPDERFILSITWEDGRVKDVKVERPHPKRPLTRKGATPKIMERTGRRVRTRR